VYFRPTRTVPQTIDLFSDQSRDIADALSKTVVANPLPGHDQPSLGGLNILRIVLGERAVVDESAKHKAKIQPYAVETAYSYWVPSAYKPKLDEKLDQVSQEKARRLLALGQKFTRVVDAEQRFEDNYLSEIDRRLKLARLSMSTERRDRIKDRFATRLRSLTQMLNDEHQCRHLAVPLEGVPVPEMWEDPLSKAVLIESFCDNVSWKLNHSGNRPPLIITTLRKWFNLRPGDTPQEIEQRINKFFTSGRKSRSDWDGWEEMRRKFGADYYTDSDSSKPDGQDYADALTELREQVQEVLKAGHFKKASLWQHEFSGWTPIEELFAKSVASQRQKVRK
jgi:hypothetical protein